MNSHKAIFQVVISRILKEINQAEDNRQKVVIFHQIDNNLKKKVIKLRTYQSEILTVI